MIKVIEMGSKLNVVDDRNNFVGFDLEDDCCAHGGYFIAGHEVMKDFDSAPKIDRKDFEEYIFDEAYFKDHEPGENEYGEGNVVIFRLIPSWSHRGLPPLYLHLFNVHNGYYSKSWKSTFGKDKEGSV